MRRSTLRQSDNTRAGRGVPWLQCTDSKEAFQSQTSRHLPKRPLACGARDARGDSETASLDSILGRFHKIPILVGRQIVLGRHFGGFFFNAGNNLVRHRRTQFDAELKQDLP